MEGLAAVELHPAARSAAHTKLMHLVDAPKLASWAVECKTCHANLAQKVSSLLVNENEFDTWTSSCEIPH